MAQHATTDSGPIDLLNHPKEYMYALSFLQFQYDIFARRFKCQNVPGPCKIGAILYSKHYSIWSGIIPFVSSLCIYRVVIW